MISSHWKAFFAEAAVNGVLISPGVVGLQKLCESLLGQHCEEDHIAHFLTAYNMSITENVAENKFYALLVFLGCDFETSDDEDDENLPKPVKQQKTRSFAVEVKPEQVPDQELAQSSVLQSYYITDYSTPPLFEELTVDEKALVMQAQKQNRV